MNEPNYEASIVMEIIKAGIEHRKALKPYADMLLLNEQAYAELIKSAVFTNATVQEGAGQVECFRGMPIAIFKGGPRVSFVTSTAGYEWASQQDWFNA